MSKSSRVCVIQHWQFCPTEINQFKSDYASVRSNFDIFSVSRIHWQVPDNEVAEFQCVCCSGRGPSCDVTVEPITGAMTMSDNSINTTSSQSQQRSSEAVMTSSVSTSGLTRCMPDTRGLDWYSLLTDSCFWLKLSDSVMHVAWFGVCVGDWVVNLVETVFFWSYLEYRKTKCAGCILTIAPLKGVMM